MTDENNETIVVCKACGLYFNEADLPYICGMYDYTCEYCGGELE